MNLKITIPESIELYEITIMDLINIMVELNNVVKDPKVSLADKKTYVSEINSIFGSIIGDMENDVIKVFNNIGDIRETIKDIIKEFIKINESIYTEDSDFSTVYDKLKLLCLLKIMIIRNSGKITTYKSPCMASLDYIDSLISIHKECMIYNYKNNIVMENKQAEQNNEIIKMMAQQNQQNNNFNNIMSQLSQVNSKDYQKEGVTATASQINDLDAEMARIRQKIGNESPIINPDNPFFHDDPSNKNINPV